MTLFEYAIIFEGEKARVVKGEENGRWKRKPTLIACERILARDEQEAGIIAARAIPEKHVEELDRITIALRPF